MTTVPAALLVLGLQIGAAAVAGAEVMAAETGATETGAAKTGAAKTGAAKTGASTIRTSATALTSSAETSDTAPRTAAATDAAPGKSCREASPGEHSRHVLIVSGLGGEDYFRRLFVRWAVDFYRLAHADLNIPRECIVYLAALGEFDSANDAATTGPHTSAAPDTAPSSTGSSDPANRPAGGLARNPADELAADLAGTADGPAHKVRILDEIARLAQASQPDDIVLLFVIGHGTARGEDARFNIPGPDLTPVELDRALATLAGRQTVVVLAASASGAFMTTLSGHGRVVVTATSSGQENRYSRFGGAFVEAYASPEADTDKNGRTSVTEAFEYARHRVTGIYNRERRLQTEHAILDDQDEGHVAAALHLAFHPSLVDGLRRPPAVLALERNARRLVERIEGLKRDRRGLSQEEFDIDLEALLVELALNQRGLRLKVQALPSNAATPQAAGDTAGSAGANSGRHPAPPGAATRQRDTNQ